MKILVLPKPIEGVSREELLSHAAAEIQASPETQRQMLTGFLQAVQAGEMTALMNLLAEDVTFWADGGGKVKGAALHQIAGRDAVARFILASTPIFRSTLPESSRVELREVNGQPARVMSAG
jgi:RNA polymerase sigma-70 factor, ECF subfamily